LYNSNFIFAFCGASRSCMIVDGGYGIDHCWIPAVLHDTTRTIISSHGSLGQGMGAVTWGVLSQVFHVVSRSHGQHSIGRQVRCAL
jgi:hypothetical protein